MIREGNVTGNFLHSKAEVTWGYPLTMIIYVLGILTLIQELLTVHLGVTQPCHADDSGAVGTLAGILGHLDYLMV